MSPVLAIVLLWVGFAGSHLVLSSVPVRQRLTARIGEPRFRGLYSLLAFAFFIPLTWVYFANKHAGPLLWTPMHGPAVRWIVYAGMGLAFVLLAASFVQPSPASVVPGDTTPKGVLRLTRHPLLMAIAVFGLVHLLPNAHAADVAYFAGFPLFATIGAWHQDQRKLVTVPKFREFYERTPFFPFTGRHTLRGMVELPLVAVGVGALLAVTVRYFHGSLFGG
jgi:uncharacterized membrane protein